MSTNQPVVFITKLGVARKVPRSRIWIEGKRLVAAGFTVGKYFYKEWNIIDQDPADLSLVLTLAKATDVMGNMPCKVSGKGEKPIIDITGEAVFEAFGRRVTHVEVYYMKGEIQISRSRDEEHGMFA